MESLLLHALFGLLLIVPWQSVKGIELLNEAVVRDPDARVNFYRNAIASQWMLALIALALLWNADPQYGRSLFFAQTSTDALLVFGLAAALLMSQSPLLPFVRDRMERSDAARRALYPIRNIIPRTAKEKQLWITVSLTAGVCEEILFRAFLFFYAQEVLGLEVVATIALSSAVFAIGHIYQGTANMIRVAVIGTILGIVFAATGNLIWCIALHTLLDLGALRMDTFVPADEPREQKLNLDES